MPAPLAILLALGAAAPARTCPALFGAAPAPVAGVLEVVEGADCVDIVQSAGFAAPVPERVRGIDLVSTDPRAGTATLRVDPELAGVCAPGLYAVSRDALLGDLRVIAVLTGALLVLDGDRLAYLTVPGARSPVFRMTWASPWRLVTSPSPGGTPASTGANVEAAPVIDPRSTPDYRRHLRSEGRL